MYDAPSRPDRRPIDPRGERVMPLVKCAYCQDRFANVAASRTHVAAEHDPDPDPAAGVTEGAA